MKETKKMTEFGETLNTALNSTKNYVWRSFNGTETKLIDMSQKDLENAYKHVWEMLYNKSKSTPGKYQVKKNIQSYILACNTELFLRYLLYECNIDSLKSNLQIMDYVRATKEASNLSNSDSVSMIFTNLPQEFKSVTIGSLLDACLDRLGVINRKMITDKFILSQGVWLTDKEKKDLTEFDETGKRRPWLEVIKERLMLPLGTTLRLNSHGLCYKEIRAILHLTELPKISSIPTDTLLLLRDKIFILLDYETDLAIDKWNTLKKQIEEVAKEKRINLI